MNLYLSVGKKKLKIDFGITANVTQVYLVADLKNENFKFR